MSKIEDESIPIPIQDLRRELQNESIVGADFHFLKDYKFNSISQAACVIYGGSRNGNIVWGLK